MAYFSSEIVARTRFEEEALKLGEAIGTRVMTRVLDRIA